MIPLRVLIALTLLVTVPTVAAAQTWQPRPGEPAIDPHRYQADQHRLQMDRLRAQADQRDAFARELAMEARLNRQRIDAIGPTEPIQPSLLRGLRSSEEERGLRRWASERRVAIAADVGQIDAWLDRPRD